MMLKTEVIKINPEQPRISDIRKASEILRHGGLVAFPTDTVYGLGADLWNKSALVRLSKVKNRPKDKPFTVAIWNITQLADLGCEISPYAYRFADRFWPGPLTLILQSRHGEKIGARMPDSKIALSILKECFAPVALPSANLSGNRPPGTADEALRDLDGKIEMVVDGGGVKIGVESTVIDLTVFPYKILREGAVKNEDLERVPKKSILFVCTGNSCRSIMAEGLLKQAIAEKSKNYIEVLSAGIIGIDGARPTDETVEVMSESGVDVSGFASRALTLDLIKRADLILVMQEMHKREILSRTPHVRHKVYLLREFTKDEAIKDGFNLEIPDPVTKPAEVYKRVRDIIQRNIDKLSEMI